MWYELTMSRCKGKSASYTLTAVTNGLIRPWEVRKGGTSAYDGTPLEPVIDALKLLGMLSLNMKLPDATHTLNMKLNALRKRMTNLIALSSLKDDAEQSVKHSDDTDNYFESV